MRNFRTAVLLYLLSLVCACKNETADIIPIKRYPIPQVVQDYLVFKPGSYWIYQDSVSGITDSIGFISDSTWTSKFHYPNSLNYIDYMKLYNYDLELQRQQAYEIQPEQFLNNPDSIYTTNSINLTIEEPAQFFYPFTLKNVVTNYDTSWLTNKIINYSLNGNMFSNVLEFANSNHYHFGNYFSYHFYVQHIGLIEFTDSAKDYKLIRYHLN